LINIPVELIPDWQTGPEMSDGTYNDVASHHSSDISQQLGLTLRVGNVGQKVENLTQNIANLDQNVTNLDQNITNLDQKITNLDQNMDELKREFLDLKELFAQMIMLLQNSQKAAAAAAATAAAAAAAAPKELVITTQFVKAGTTDIVFVDVIVLPLNPTLAMVHESINERIQDRKLSGQISDIYYGKMRLDRDVQLKSIVGLVTFIVHLQ